MTCSRHRVLSNGGCAPPYSAGRISLGMCWCNDVKSLPCVMIWEGEKEIELNLRFHMSQATTHTRRRIFSFRNGLSIANIASKYIGWCKMWNALNRMGNASCTTSTVRLPKCGDRNFAWAKLTPAMSNRTVSPPICVRGSRIAFSSASTLLRNTFSTGHLYGSQFSGREKIRKWWYEIQV